MESLGNQHFQLNSVARKSNIGMVLGICVFFAGLLYFRAVSNVFFYVFAGVSLVTFAVGSVPLCMYLLLFLLPFSAILKINVGQITFYTPLFFLTVIKMLWEQKGIQKNVFFAIAIFVIYALLNSGFSALTTMITMAAGLLMLYFLRNTKVDAKTAITAFALGIVFASALALMKDSFPLISTLVSDAALKIDAGEYASRFSGLVGNPNYYTMDIIMALSALVVFLYSKKIPQKYMWYMLLLSALGIMSVSKSFLICWIILLAIWLILSLRQGIGGAIRYVLIAALCLVGVYILAFDSVNLYLFRLAQDSEGELDDLFTGRLDIWKGYLEIIFSNQKILLFGNGLGTMADFGRGTHNTYLDALFNLGIVGSGVFMFALKQSFGKIVVRPIMWVPVLMLLIRMMAIGYLTSDNLWLYLALFVIMAREVTNQG